MKQYESPKISITSLISDRAIALMKESGENFVSDIWFDDTESGEDKQ